MKLVIDIPAVTYEEVKWRGLYLCPRDSEALVNSIKNGAQYEERQRGEWIEVYLTPEEKRFYGELWECSACRVKDKKSNFCPNCGSDNRVKEGGVK